MPTPGARSIEAAVGSGVRHRLLAPRFASALGGTRRAARWKTNAKKAAWVSLGGLPKSVETTLGFRLGMGLRVERRDGGAIQKAPAGFEG